VSLVLSGILCFVQALLVNGIINSNKILPRKSYVGGLFVIIFSSLFKEGLLLSPASLALTFLILFISRLFSLFKKDKPNSEIFDIGFFIAVATLFYFPSILFIILAFIDMATIRPFVIREWIIVLTGFVCPFYLLFVVYFWFDRTGFLLPDIVNLQNGVWLRAIAMGYVRWSMIGAVTLLTLLLLVMVPSTLYSKLIQVRKFSTLLVVFIVFAGVSFLLQQKINLSHFVLLSLPLGIISSLVAMQIKSKLVSEVVHLILILLVVTGQFLPLFNFF
jgi:hypothetical protein